MLTPKDWGGALRVFSRSFFSGNLRATLNFLFCYIHDFSKTYIFISKGHFIINWVRLSDLLIDMHVTTNASFSLERMNKSLSK